MIARIGAGALLVVVWLLLWGDVTVANILSGIAVVAILFVVFPPALSGSPIRVHPISVAHLAIWFTAQIIISNILLIRLVFTKESRVRRGVLRVALPGCSDSLLRFNAHLTALTPGTMTVELRGEPSTIYIHAFMLADIERARRETLRLNELIVRAFGTSDEIAQLQEPPR